MKTIMKPMLAALLCAFAATGCATMHGPTDEEMIQSTVGTMKQALEKKDLELLMTTFSDGYMDPRVGDKAAAKILLSQGLSSGYADNGKVDMERMKIKMSEDSKSATIYPIDLSSNAGAVAVELVLSKEKDGWFITAVHPDGV